MPTLTIQVDIDMEPKDLLQIECAVQCALNEFEEDHTVVRCDFSEEDLPEIAAVVNDSVMSA